MDRILLSGKQRIKIKEMREFREIVEELVAKSGVDFEFPEETEPSIALKIMLRRLRIVATFLTLFIFFDLDDIRRVWCFFYSSNIDIFGWMGYALLNVCTGPHYSYRPII